MACCTLALEAEWSSTVGSVRSHWSWPHGTVVLHIAQGSGGAWHRILLTMLWTEMLSIQSNYSNAHLGDMKGAVSPNEHILLHTVLYRKWMEEKGKMVGRQPCPIKYQTSNSITNKKNVFFCCLNVRTTLPAGMPSRCGNARSTEASGETEVMEDNRWGQQRPWERQWSWERQRSRRITGEVTYRGH